jgi:hypothetical protein
MKMKLLDTKIIHGSVFIDRSKNLGKEYYEVIENDARGGDMKVTYKKKQKMIFGKEQTIDFEKMMKERRP